MATRPGRVHARKSNSYKLCRFADFLDHHWVSHGTDQQGELPLMKDVLSWNKASHSSIRKASGAPKQPSNENNLWCNQRRSHGSENQVEAGAFGTGTRRLVIWQSPLFHQERDSSRPKMGGSFQVDCTPNPKAPAGIYGLGQSSLSFSKHSWDDTGDHTDDDDVSLQHWLNPGCNAEVARMSSHQRQKSKIDARESRSSELTRARRELSPTHVCEVFHREHRKKRKLLTSRESKQLSPKDVEALWPLSLNEDHKRIYPQGHHHSPCFAIKQPMLAQQKHESRGLTFTDLESRKLLIKFLKGRLLSRKDVKVTYFDKDLAIKEIPRSGMSKPSRRSTGKYQRKTLLNSSRTGHLSDPYVRKLGSSRVVNEKTQRKSSTVCMLEVQNKKKRDAMSCPTVALACSNNPHVGGRLKDNSCFMAKVSISSLRLAANRKTLRKGRRTLHSETRENCRPDSWGLRVRSLSEKYRPKMLQDLIGQSIIARALSSAISNDKVAPVYLFEGSHGTGKTSAARIFAMALNCGTLKKKKPCGLCNECSALISGKASCVWEFDAASHNGVGCMLELIKSVNSASSSPRYKIVIVDECHMFSMETWSALMKLFEEPPSNAVFILITTELDKLPLTIMSRCQRYHFLRIRHSDIVSRLEHIAKLERFITESGALSLIASKSDGSLRNAETVLDQVSLLEPKITSATIHKLVGSVSDDKLTSLLDLALCSDMVGTIQKTREIIDFGVDPLDLLSLLATLITDILADSYVPMGPCKKEGSLRIHALSEVEMVRLQNALRVLLEAERQVRAASAYRTTWLIAALVQLAPLLQRKFKANSLRMGFAKASPTTQFTILRAKCTEGSQGIRGVTSQGSEAGVKDESMKSVANKEIHLHLKSPNNVGSLWPNVLKCCRPLSVRQLLQNHAKLLALTFSAVNIVAHLLFKKPTDKNAAEIYRMYILNSFKRVLGPSVEVQFSLASDLRGADFSNSLAAIFDTSYTQSAGCEGYARPVNKESFDAGRPLDDKLSCPPLLKGSSHSLGGTKPTIPEETASSTANPLANGHFLMHCFPKIRPKNLECSDNLRALFFKKELGRSCFEALRA